MQRPEPLKFLGLASTGLSFHRNLPAEKVRKLFVFFSVGFSFLYLPYTFLLFVIFGKVIEKSKGRKGRVE